MKRTRALQGALLVSLTAFSSRAFAAPAAAAPSMSRGPAIVQNEGRPSVSSPLTSVPAASAISSAPVARAASAASAASPASAASAASAAEFAAAAAASAAEEKTRLENRKLGLEIVALQPSAASAAQRTRLETRKLELEISKLQSFTELFAPWSPALAILVSVLLALFARASERRKQIHEKRLEVYAKVFHATSGLALYFPANYLTAKQCRHIAEQLGAVYFHYTGALLGDDTIENYLIHDNQ